MAAEPARRSARSTLASEPGRAPRHREPRASVGRAARIERQRRERHMRRLRRDLLVDVVSAIMLTMFVLLVTAGLGVIALLEVPVAGAVVGSYVLERSIRKRRSARPDRVRRRSSRPADG